MRCQERSHSIELAHRWFAGIDVTLLWTQRHPVDEMVVCVFDQRDGTYFEIPAEPYLALDVYYHPFFYRDFSDVLLPDGKPDQAPWWKRAARPHAVEVRA